MSNNRSSVSGSELIDCMEFRGRAVNVLRGSCSKCSQGVVQLMFSGGRAVNVQRGSCS